jgi:hypothetical protein
MRALWVLPLLACTESASLQGEWVGTLSCEDEEVGAYGLDMTLTLADGKEERTALGKLLTFAAYEGYDEATDVTWPITISREYEVEAVFRFAEGAQEVQFTEVCLDVLVISDGEPVPEMDSCPEVEDEGGVEIVSWDGEDAMAFNHAGCIGGLVR